MKKSWQDIADKYSDAQLLQLIEAEYKEFTNTGAHTEDSAENMYKICDDLQENNIVGEPFVSDHHYLVFLSQALAQRLKAYKENNYNPQLP